MKEILRNLQWIIIGQAVGLLCLFAAYFLPEEYGVFSTILFTFGVVAVAGYLLLLWKNVYQKLKEPEQEK